MRPSLYHLKLELYPPLPSAADPSKPSTAYTPPQGTDIFSTALPVHRTAPRERDPQQKRPRSVLLASGTRTPELRPGDHHSATGDALLLPERNTALRDSPARLPSSPKPSPQHAREDWRFGPVTIDSIDMEPAKDGSAAGSGQVSKASNGTVHTRAVYVPSDTKTTEVGVGVVHLYRDAQDGTDLGPPRFDGRHSLSGGADFDIDKCSTICILAVPSWMMPSDLLGFVGDQTKEDVSHFRLIRTGRANKYMALMKFRSPKKAREWQKAWNGRLFSAMEPENCHVVFIKSVQFVTPDSGDMSFPQNNSDPFTAPSRTARPSITASSKPLAPPTPSLIELPTCPVCLERMDETTGLLTILCQHVFHCACLEKWRGSGCPVCRYTQSPSSVFPYPSPDTTSALADPSCSVCASSSNLWVCLICGNVGCGRYDSAHAYAHYESTSHCYAMDITSQHVWDYAGDGYVHRLIQNKETVSLQMPSRAHPNAAFREEAGDVVPREKMDNMAEEYTYLLTSQLDSQRRYFEEQVQRAVDKASAASAKADEALSQLTAAMAQLTAATSAAEEQRMALAAAEAERDKALARAERLDRTARQALGSLAEERSLSKGLVDRNKALEEKEKHWTGEKEELKTQLAEMEELNRDLTIFVSGQEELKRLEEQGEEVAGGEAIVGQSRRRRRAR